MLGEPVRCRSMPPNFFGDLNGSKERFATILCVHNAGKGAYDS